MIRDATTVTIVGRVGTNPQVSLGSTGDRVSFRVVATDRRFDKATGGWVDGEECWLTVVCWQGLANAVMTTIRKGDPVVVLGRINHRRFEKNGVTQYFTDIKAELVGLDTIRLGSRFSRNLADAAQPQESAAVEADVPEPAAGEQGEQATAADAWREDPEDEPTPWDTEETPAGDRDGALAPAQ